MDIVVYGVIFFLLIVLFLVALLLGARKKLVNMADVKIIVNGDRANPIIAPAGISRQAPSPRRLQPVPRAATKPPRRQRGPERARRNNRPSLRSRL